MTYFADVPKEKSLSNERKRMKLINLDKKHRLKEINKADDEEELDFWKIEMDKEEE